MSTNSPTPAPSKKSINILGWANLIVTLFVGAFIGVYLHYLDEQNALLNLRVQADIQRTYGLAHLRVSNIYSGVKITNNGLATANNVKFTVTMYSINQIWSKYLHTIDQLRIETSPILYDSLEFGHYDLQGSEDILGKNTVRISFNGLASGETIDINVELGAAIPTQPQTLGSEITLNTTYHLETFIKASSLEAQMLAIPLANDYLRNKFEIANFYVTTGCSNCERKATDITNSDIGLISLQACMPTIAGISS